MRKNLFDIDHNNSSEVDYGSLKKACDPCASECEKIDNKINGRKLSEFKDEEVPHILSPFNVKE